SGLPALARGDPGRPPRRDRSPALTAAAGPLVALAIGLVALVLGLGGVAGNAWTVPVPWLVPLGGLELTLDPLAGLFLAPVVGAAAPSVGSVQSAGGFASKAGVAPLRVWLPLAHPAAPSHVSALMSGVMIKLGV